MTGMGANAGSGATGGVRADLQTSEVEVTLGEPVVLWLDVTNLDPVIRSYRVTLLGLDPEWVTVDDATLDLFPEERRQVPVTLQLPAAFPAGRRRVGVEVSEPRPLDTPLPGGTGINGDGPEPGALTTTVDLELIVPASDGVELGVEPETVTAGQDATFVLDVGNTGNTTIAPTIVADDPERLTTVTFDPPDPRILPGERAVVATTMHAKRPWFGMPVVRVLTMSVTAGQASDLRPAVFVQKPRVGRRALAILGLILVASIFAIVITQAFSSVADRAAANEELLRQGLGEDGVSARTTPGDLEGSVVSSTGGPIDGAVVELFDPDSPILPVQATVTNAQGMFTFRSLTPDEYLLAVEVAGFDELWWPNGETIGDADPIEISPGNSLDDLVIELVGRPGSASGTVIGPDDAVEGAVVTAQLPADTLEGSEVAEIPSKLTAQELDATGEFLLEELPTPATYELEVRQEGFATETFTVSLSPGEQRDGIEVLLRTGGGRIAGDVVDTAGDPVPNAEITATDGSTTVETRSLSGAGEAGEFELRDLVSPGTYTLTVAADGFGTESITVQLDEEEQVDDLQVVLTSGVGSLSGRVTDANGNPLGSVDVTIDGAEVDRRTASLSTGDVGRWLASDLPVPGAYTVTFSGEGRATQALSVELRSGPDANRTGIDVVMTDAQASVRGRVTDPDGGPIGGVSIALEGDEVERRTVSSNDPPGAYGFDSLPAGAYTITFERAGSRGQTLLVDLNAGQTLSVPDVQLEEQATIRGVVQRDGIGESGVGVDVYTLDGYPREVVTSTVTGTGGAFEVVGLEAPETYVVEFRVPAGGNVVGSQTTFLQTGDTVELEFDL